MFQLANVYGFAPDVIDGLPALRTVQPGPEQIVNQWHQAQENYSADIASYQSWVDTYNPEAAKSEYESRSHPAWDSNSRMCDMEIYYDKFDFGYKEGFFEPYTTYETLNLNYPLI